MLIKSLLGPEGSKTRLKLARTAVKRGIAGFTGEPIRFTSGIWSPGMYVDNRKWPSFVSDWTWIVDQFARRVRRSKFDTIAGVESGSIALASLVAYQKRMPFVFVRKKLKKVGLKKRVEGDSSAVRDRRVLLMEDVGTTGKSSGEAMDGLDGDGAKTSTIFFISIYGFPKLDQMLRERNLDGYTLITAHDLLRAAMDMGKVEGRHVPLIESWLQNPEQWKTRRAVTRALANA